MKETKKGRKQTKKEFGQRKKKTNSENYTEREVAKNNHEG